MPSRLAYIDEPAPKERHRDAVPEGVTFAQARIPAVDSDAREVYIGTPDPEKEAQAHTDWAEVKRKYEAEREDEEGSVHPELQIHVVPEMDPEPSDPEPQSELKDVVGTRQANALLDAGYGTLAAAQALPKEEFLEIGGVGEGTYNKLHESDS